MTKSEARAAAALLRSVLAILLGMVSGRSDEAAELRRLVGALTEDAEAKVAAASFGADLLACFDAARLAGAAFASFTRVDRFAFAARADGNPSIAVIVASLRFSVIERARIAAATEFGSLAQVEAAQISLNASFGAAVDYAADAGDQESYRALLALHSAITRDLKDRARYMPRIIAYDVRTSMPSLALANRLYGDGSRADELRAENDVPHPLFMPPAGRALSA